MKFFEGKLTHVYAVSGTGITKIATDSRFDSFPKLQELPTCTLVSHLLRPFRRKGKRG